MRVLEIEVEILKRTSAYFARKKRPPQMIYPVVRDLSADQIAVATACRVLELDLELLRVGQLPG
jgi:hypothetical protein